jgi:hypothetical protein
MLIVLDNIESDDTSSKADFRDFRADSIDQDADSFSLEASFKATTPFSSSCPCHHDPNSIIGRAAKIGEIDIETDITETENSHRPLKRNASKTQRQNHAEIKVARKTPTYLSSLCT